MLTCIFVPYDAVRRKTRALETLAGHFAVTATVCATSYVLAWPLETLKNLYQREYPRRKRPSLSGSVTLEEPEACTAACGQARYAADYGTAVGSLR